MKRLGDGELRIIGGQWKRRRLRFPALEGLRPTADRVRETLFNWLQFDLHGSRCLDLFAGSGACGLEALSRGAASVLFVEQASPAAAALRANLALLQVSPEQARVMQADALRWLREHPPWAPFDVVFVDPPYAANLLQPALQALQDAAVMAPGALVYVEDRQPLAQQLPAQWQLLRERRAGAVYFGLCRTP